MSTQCCLRKPSGYFRLTDTLLIWVSAARYRRVLSVLTDSADALITVGDDQGQKECTSSPGGPISATPVGSCACAIASGLKVSRSSLISPASATRYPVNKWWTVRPVAAAREVCARRTGDIPLGGCGGTGRQPLGPEARYSNSRAFGGCSIIDRITGINWQITESLSGDREQWTD